MQMLPFAPHPEDAGVSSEAILRFLDAAQAQDVQFHALWVLRHGQVACRMNFAPYDEKTPHMLFSLSKSFCSAAAGFAVQEGLMNWDTRLADVLPDELPANPSPRLLAVTLHHLLTMGSGLKPESDEGTEEEDWARAALSFDCDHDPGTHFHYNSHGTYLISRMIQRLTGQTVRDYLIPRLFEPLGMMNPDGSAPKWDCCPQGVNTGGWGLWLSCGQIARFGQCLLQKGVWDGRQVLPPEWLARATVPQIDNSNGGVRDNDWTLGYGYQFWMCRGGRYRGDGMFAQLCIVDEARDMVVCCVSGQGDIGKALTVIYDHLLSDEVDAPSTPEKQQELRHRLAALAYPWPENDGSGFTGHFAAENFTLDLEADAISLPQLDVEKTRFALGIPEAQGDLRTFAGWHKGELSLLIRVVNAPFTLAMRVRFAGDEAEVDVSGIGVDSRTLTLHRA